MDTSEEAVTEKGVVSPSMMHQSLEAVSAISIDVVRACGVRWVVGGQQAPNEPSGQVMPGPCSVAYKSCVSQSGPLRAMLMSEHEPRLGWLRKPNNNYRFIIILGMTRNRSLIAD